jgi:uncharacterized Ntn-hydrolase superfamily protein
MLRAGTYSIVARDAATGEVGVAVQSHWFSVGSVVPWTRAGVGAVATQALPDPAMGPRLLDRLQAGEDPAAALGAELTGDDLAAHRQVGLVSADGRAAAHSGGHCMAHAGHAVGDAVSCQANVMAGTGVWGAMADAFGAADAALPLARRLLLALHAAEAAGGDVRGRQSCAIAVAPAAGEPWRRTVDLRVEDHPEPVAEMARLLDVHDAYVLATLGDVLAGEGRHEEAGDAYRRAAERAPDNPELLFWSGLSASAAGRPEQAVEQVRRAIELQPGWAELLARLPAALAPGAPAVRAALGLD